MKQLLHIKSGVKSRNKFDLSREHYTTIDFGQVLPIFHEDIIAGDQYNINPHFFSRLSPLVLPSYGKVSFRTIPMFVPYHQVYENYEAWLVGKKVDKGRSVGLPVIKMRDLMEYFAKNNCYEDVTADVAYDIVRYGTSNTPIYSRFNNKGRYIYKVLRMLGYQLLPNYNFNSPTEFDYYLNAMPLLCFAKAFNDYMTLNSQYSVSNLTKTLESIRISSNVDVVNGNRYIYVSTQLITDLFAVLHPLFENDYFTSAWQSPNSPLSDIGDIQDNRVYPNPFDTTGEHPFTATAQQTDTSSWNSQRMGETALNLLRSFDDWIRRNNYSGTKTVQRILSRFGIKIEDYSIYFAHVLSGVQNTPLQIGDVTSTSQTDGADLGDYAGKGIVSGGVKPLHFKSDDFGMLLYLGWLNVKPMYGHGFDRNVLKLQPFDMYQPEFDCVGPNPISQGELAVSLTNMADQKKDVINNVFGYTERYNEYRKGTSQVTGDFALIKSKKTLTPWLFDRLELVDETTYESRDFSPQTTLFNLNDGQEFNRIFVQEDSEKLNVDHFFMSMNFDVMAVRPILSLSQSTNLGEGRLEFEKNGNDVV
ncbi:major capsid protein [Capybara microvirus Cap1_SP_70]|nr:major capsid protein [Capybara microvirus Cap1_SP_70]